MDEQTWKVPTEFAAKHSWEEAKRHARRAERVQLAGMAMMGMLAYGRCFPSFIDANAEEAARYADALLAELDRTEKISNLRHVCGERGYNGMIDQACPACEQSRARAQEQSR